MLKIIYSVFYSELILRLRHSREWLYPLGFFIIIIILFPLAISPDPVFLQKAIPGCIWISALLASLLSIESIFFTDTEDGYLEQMLLSQTPLTFILLAKLGAHWLVTELPLILLTPVLGFLFHLSFLAIVGLCTSLLIGTPILIMLGSLGVALTLGLRQQGVLLGLLILPLTIPVIIFGVAIVQQIQAGFSIKGSLAFLTSLLLLALTLLPISIAATLRVSVDD